MTKKETNIAIIEAAIATGFAENKDYSEQEVYTILSNIGSSPKKTRKEIIQATLDNLGLGENDNYLNYKDKDTIRQEQNKIKAATKKIKHSIKSANSNSQELETINSAFKGLGSGRPTGNKFLKDTKKLMNRSLNRMLSLWGKHNNNLYTKVIDEAGFTGNYTLDSLDSNEVEGAKEDLIKRSERIIQEAQDIQGMAESIINHFQQIRRDLHA